MGGRWETKGYVKMDCMGWCTNICITVITRLYTCSYWDTFFFLSFTGKDGTGYRFCFFLRRRRTGAGTEVEGLMEIGGEAVEMRAW